MKRMATVTFPKGTIECECNENLILFIPEPLDEDLISDLSLVKVHMDPETIMMEVPTIDEDGNEIISEEEVVGSEAVDMSYENPRLLTFALDVKIPSTGKPGYAFKFADPDMYPDVTIETDDETVTGFLNGGVYILDKEIKEGNYGAIVLTTRDKRETLFNMVISEVRNPEWRGYAYSIDNIPADVLRQQQIQSNLEYLAMMTDVDLEV